MIYAIGIDTVDIVRLQEWRTYSRKQLRRIFSDQEIDYCLEHVALSAQRFAARFAAREAFFKALSMYNPHHTISFLHVCKLLSIIKINTIPTIHIEQKNKMELFNSTTVEILLSLTHSIDTATAIVLLQSS